jgi:hypothetical protein
MIAKSILRFIALSWVGVIFNESGVPVSRTASASVLFLCMEARWDNIRGLRKEKVSSWDAEPKIPNTELEQAVHSQCIDNLARYSADNTYCVAPKWPYHPMGFLVSAGNHARN